VPQFGDSQKLRLVRILRSTVMVRVGGGWVALDEFLVKNDPCRGKHLPFIPGLLLEDVIYIWLKPEDTLSLQFMLYLLNDIYLTALV
jgi:hypothetical protein